MFIIALLLLWTIAAIIIAADPKNDANRWCSLAAFFVGLGIWHPIIQDIIIPHLQEFPAIYHHLIQPLRLFATCVSALSFYFFPYCLLMYGITHLEFLKLRWPKYKAWIALILLIPILAMLLLFPMGPIGKIPNPGSPLRTHSQVWFIVLIAWVVPYVLCANYLFIYAYRQARNPRLKQESLQTFLVVAPSTLSATSFNYVSAALGYPELWRYEFWIFLYLFVSFIFFAIKDSAMGARITIEKQFHSTMRAMSSGTAVLNHAIKNETMNISICISNIKPLIEQADPTVAKNLQLIQNSTDHMMALVNRIQDHIQDVVLEDSEDSAVMLLEKALSLIQPLLDAGQIRVIKEYDVDVRLKCDPAHIQEILCNILKNAVEAIPVKGEITVQIYLEKKHLVIAVRDNGEGIAKEDLPHVIEPFYSTKSSRNNFGLGLSYCYNVMRKHGGSLEIFSEKNQGTTVFLLFPPRKVLLEHDVLDGRTETRLHA